MVIYFSIVVILIAVILLLINKRFNLTNPLVFLWTTWLSALVICLLNVFSVYPKLSTYTLILIASYLVITTVAFKVGKQVIPFIPAYVNYSERRLLQAFNFLFIIVVMAYVITIVRLGPPPMFGGGIRSKYYLSGGGELLYLLVFPCFFIGLSLIRQKKVPKVKSKVGFQLLLLFVIIASRGNKMAIFTIILMVCFLFGHRVNLANMILLLMGIVIIFALASMIYKRDVANISALKASKINLTGFSLPNSLYPLYDPLIYLSSNLSNIEGLVRAHLSGVGMGALSFKGIYQLAALVYPSLVNSTPHALEVINTSLVVPDFSTFSGLGELYFDFGPLIALLCFAIIGFVAGALSPLNSSLNSSLSGKFFSFLLFQTIALSFFTFYLGNLEVITNLLVCWLVDIYSRKPDGGIPNV